MSFRRHKPALCLLAYLSLLLALVLYTRAAGAQERPRGRAWQSSPVEAEAHIGISARVLDISGPMDPDPDNRIRWVIEYPYPGRRDVLLAFPEGL